MNDHFLSGYKTHLMSLLILMYAIAGVILGYHDANHAVELVLASGALSALRLGVSKTEF